MLKTHDLDIIWGKYKYVYRKVVTKLYSGIYIYRIYLNIRRGFLPKYRFEKLGVVLKSQTKR